MNITPHFLNYNQNIYTKNAKKSPSFNGILLKNVSFEEVRDVVMFLRMKGYYDLGFKKYYTAKPQMSEFIKIAKEARLRGLSGYQDEFGTLIFPWAKKAYIIGNIKEEPHILDQVYRVTPKAEWHSLV